MAEVVERNLEQSLNEILYMKKIKLFQKQEINDIINKRRNHEYSIQKRNKRILDYESYISTEMAILKLVRFRRQLTQDSRYVDKIERSILSRLVRLHRQLCYRFQSHIDLWIRFIKFYKLIGRHMSIVRLWNHILQIHGRTEPKLWAAAASYILHDNTKAKARGNIKNLSEQKNSLVNNRKKLQQEYRLLSHYASEQDKNKLEELLDELKQNTASLTSVVRDLDRERRLAWDRAHLNAIREARRLLTEGLNLNPDCDYLHLELVKLELIAMDFFRTRVLVRSKLNNNDDELFKGGKIKKRRISRRMATDNSEFMSEINEDINFITTGGAVNMVIDVVLDRWKTNRKMLESLDELIKSVNNLNIDHIVSKVTASLNNIEQYETPMIIQSNESPLSNPNQEISEILSKQLSDLHTILMKQDIISLINLWDSWYIPSISTSPYSSSSSTSSSCISQSSFRFLNPNLPQAVGLLKTRIVAISLLVNYLSQLINDSVPHSTTTTTNDDNNELNQKKQFLNNTINTTRSLLDTLATSRWGTDCSEFWILYLDFEKSVGDFTRLPAIRWKAQKTLKTEYFDQFINLLDNT